MGVDRPLDLSIGEWEMIVRGWSRAHAKEGGAKAPSPEEFEAAVAAVRGRDGY